MNEIVPGSVWKHANGIYTVICITNLPDTERYPKSVTYQGANGNLWSRRYDDWHRSMSYLGHTSTLESNDILEQLIFEETKDEKYLYEPTPKF